MWRTSETCYHWLKTCGKEIFLQEPIHQRCKWSVKTINHGVLEYKVAKKIWFQAPFTVQSVNVQFQDMLNTIQEMATRGKPTLNSWYCIHLITFFLVQEGLLKELWRNWTRVSYPIHIFAKKQNDTSRGNTKIIVAVGKVWSIICKVVSCKNSPPYRYGLQWCTNFVAWAL